MNPAFVSLAVYRYGRWALARKHPAARWLAKKLHGFTNFFVANITKVWIPPEVTLGDDFHIIHAEGSLSIHPDVVAGDRLGVMHNVTIGTNMRPGAPVIGDDVFIGVNSTVLATFDSATAYALPPTPPLRPTCHPIPSSSVLRQRSFRDSRPSTRRLANAPSPDPRSPPQSNFTPPRNMNTLSTTFYELLADNLPTHAQKQALVDTNRSVTYAELCSQVDRLAGYMAEHGVRPRDRVGVQLHKTIDEVVAMFSAAKLGAVVVNVNFQWTLEQLSYVADDCTLSMLLIEPRCAKRLAKQGLPRSVRHVLVHGKSPADDGRFGAWALALDAAPGATRHQLDTELAMIIYTSGSTGKPKGVMLSHRNIVAGARSVARYLKLRGDDRLISVLPYSFDYGLNQLTTMLLQGGAIVHQPVVMPFEIVRTLREERITGFAAVPPLWNQVVRYLKEKPESLPELRRVTNSGGKLSKNILELMPEVFPSTDIYLMYGLTEAFRSTYLPPEKFSDKCGSMGRAIPGAQTFVIKHGEGVAGPTEQGELVHRGPLVSLGYWGKPEPTAEKIKPCPELKSLIGEEPVVYSGDIVRVDEDGDYWFVGRTDMMIKTSGFRLSPDEVEDLVAQSGLVGDVVAFGVDDDEMGQVVHAAVSPLSEPLDEAALLTHCRRAMPHYMIPRKFHVWTRPMPRTSSGKLAKSEIIKVSASAHAKEQAS